MTDVPRALRVVRNPASTQGQVAMAGHTLAAEVERLCARDEKAKPVVQDMRDLAAKCRAKSAEYLADWQEWDSHDGHERCGQGIAYSDVADELDALARSHEGESGDS